MICGLNCIKPLSIKSVHIQKSDILFVPREQYKISLPRNPRVAEEEEERVTAQGKNRGRSPVTG